MTVPCPHGLVRRVKRHPKRLLALSLLVAGLGASFVTANALAQPNSDRAVAEKLLEELSKLPEEDRPVVLGPVENGKRALERAASARGGGDLRTGELLEGLAREWAETGRDVLLASKAEADAGAIQAEAAEAKVKAERARALLEEAITRRGRAEAELRKLMETADTEAATSEKAKPKGAR